MRLPLYTTMLVTALATTPVSAALYAVTNLDALLPSPGAVLAVNGKGWLTGTSGANGFLYANGVITDLGNLDGVSSYALAINENGQITGGSGSYGFLYSGGVMTSIGTLGGSNSSALAINSSGQITGWADRTDGQTHAILYSNGKLTDVGTLGGDFSEGWAINNVGQITGGAGYIPGGSGAEHAFIYSNGAITDIGSLGADSRGLAINNLGHVTGTSILTYSGPGHVFLYANGVMMDIGSFGGGGCAGLGINDSDEVVGYSQLPGSYPPAEPSRDPSNRAFLYANGAMTDLNTLIDPNSGWTLYYAQSIDNAGRIMGFGSDGTDVHAFLLTPTPEPTTLLLTSAIPWFMLRRQRRSSTR